jgi:hypothetical protein
MTEEGKYDLIYVGDCMASVGVDDVVWRTAECSATCLFFLLFCLTQWRVDEATEGDKDLH